MLRSSPWPGLCIAGGMALHGFSFVENGFLVVVFGTKISDVWAGLARRVLLRISATLLMRNFLVSLEQALYPHSQSVLKFLQIFCFRTFVYPFENPPPFLVHQVECS